MLLPPTSFNLNGMTLSKLPSPLRIGSLEIDPPILQAPMAGFTNYAYRQMIRHLGGAGLLATEMVNARGIVELDNRERKTPDRLWGIKDEPRPLAVQIWENDPAMLAEVGARLVSKYDVSVVDINFGCPVKRVTEKSKSGSYLLQFPDQIGKIVAQVTAACYPTPVTAKIRLGATDDTANAADVAQAVEASGAAALTVHGRTGQQMFCGSASWDEIAKIKPHLKRIPLIGNGDLKTPMDVVKAFKLYPIDGVMIGRATLSKPWLFKQSAAALCNKPIPPDPTCLEQRDLLLEHYRLVCQRFGNRKGTVLMRRYACSYAQGQRGARQFRAEVSRVTIPKEFLAAVSTYFPTDL